MGTEAMLWVVALTEAENIALITGLCVAVPACVAAIPAILAKRRADDAAGKAEVAQEAATATQEAIGTPNGRGNVVQMLERLLERQERTSEAVIELREQQGRLTGRVDAIERRQLHDGGPST